MALFYLCGALAYITNQGCDEEFVDGNRWDWVRNHYFTWNPGQVWCHPFLFKTSRINRFVNAIQIFCTISSCKISIIEVMLLIVTGEMNWIKHNVDNTMPGSCTQNIQNRKKACGTSDTKYAYKFSVPHQSLSEQICHQEEQVQLEMLLSLKPVQGVSWKAKQFEGPLNWPFNCFYFSRC